MKFEFDKIKAKAKSQEPIDPVEIFQRPRTKDASINDLWLGQGDALREWHAQRAKKDISISLNTGAGKTLVGLLIAQSLVNETKSLVVYVCSTLQLVAQTAQKAESYGIPYTTYTESRFSNDLCAQGLAVCITTYQAVFHGHSIFFSKDIAAIIFDDAHAAEHILRDQFSLNIHRDRYATVYETLMDEFQAYFEDIGLATTFNEIRTGEARSLLLAPPFEVRKAKEKITKTLASSSVVSDNSRFSWNYLKDKIDLCAIVLSAEGVTITPPFVPVNTLPYFQGSVRRIYLSATLTASDVFVRTFGRKAEVEISPKTTAGECERMILIPAKMKGTKDDIAVATKTVKPHKTLVLVPTYTRASKWVEIARPSTKETAIKDLEDFKKAKDSRKLLMVARFDGVDLPGDMCRVVAIDELPTGMGQLERFMWEYLKLNTALGSSIASRIVQSFGRISRGMGDHGVAVVTGSRLIEWLQVPRNVGSLPLFLQKQLQLGFQMSAEANSEQAVAMANACLTREKDWLGMYEQFMKEAEGEKAAPLPPNLTEIALAETKFAEYYWNRDYSKAAQYIRETLGEAAGISVNLVCWHKLWLGYVYELQNDLGTAHSLYRQAHGGQRNIPSLLTTSGKEEFGGSSQIQNVALQFEIGGDSRVKIPRVLDTDLLYLERGASSNQVEESLRCLGQYLGLNSSRPENETGTGPDVLWICPDKTAICIDAKSGMKISTSYKKEHLGQLSDHVQWVKDNCDVGKIIPVFIGPEVGFTDSANPSPGVKVAELQKFKVLGDILKTSYRDISAGALPSTVAGTVKAEFEKRRLDWPKLVDMFMLQELRDLGHKTIGDKKA